MQSKTQSLIESIANICIGYAVALVSQIVVFPIVGVQASLGQNIQIGLYFTVIALIRTYLIRRWFNKKDT